MFFFAMSMIISKLDKWKLAYKSFFRLAKSDFVWQTLIKTNLAQSPAHLLISAKTAFYLPIHPYSPYRSYIHHDMFCHFFAQRPSWGHL